MCAVSEEGRIGWRIGASECTLGLRKERDRLGDIIGPGEEEDWVRDDDVQLEGRSEEGRRKADIAVGWPAGVRVLAGRMGMETL